MLGEFDLIKRHLAALQRGSALRSDGYPESRDALAGVELGAGDDCALLVPSPHHLLAVSVDTSIADVHFPADAPAEAIGHRALAVSLSDLAAMGAQPRWCLLALSLPEVDEAWVGEFCRGFHALAARSGTRLVGGDLTRGHLSISVTVHGEVRPSAVLRRDGAEAEQLIAVSGPLGGARGGLEAWRGGSRAYEQDPLLQAYLRPQPRIEAGIALAELASAALDVSDGLLADLDHLCRASGVGAKIDLTRLPLAPGLIAALGHERAIAAALDGGDDYELLFTLPEHYLATARARLAGCGCELRVIGRTTEALGIRNWQGAPLAARGWRHFDGDGDQA
ncbi:thiamine-phosphate kinase [Halotalea alkalilenta]|uniref:thiamine-phosphate kinase n=1 Tax=Halotalea alkalilenta TaxID=376489 RepID=UPI000482CEF2|nr:thiamine-phosphate kinase [Halotalea alkalilenta]